MTSRDSTCSVMISLLFSNTNKNALVFWISLVIFTLLKYTVEFKFINVKTGKIIYIYIYF